VTGDRAAASGLGPVARRLEIEVKLTPPRDLVVRPAQIAAGCSLTHRSSTARSYATVYLDTVGRGLLGKDAALAVNLNRAGASPPGWVAIKRVVDRTGPVRHVDEQRCALLAGPWPVDAVLATRPPPVREAARLLGTDETALVVTTAQQQRRTLHRFETRDGSVVIVSDDVLMIRDPDTIEPVARLRVAEVDCADPDPDRAVLVCREIAGYLVGAGMRPLELSKYALGVRALAQRAAAAPQRGPAPRRSSRPAVPR
jgi:hypothetical protein